MHAMRAGTEFNAGGRLFPLVGVATWLGMKLAFVVKLTTQFVPIKYIQLGYPITIVDTIDLFNRYWPGLEH